MSNNKKPGPILTSHIVLLSFYITHFKPLCDMLQLIHHFVPQYLKLINTVCITLADNANHCSSFVDPMVQGREWDTASLYSMQCKSLSYCPLYSSPFSQCQTVGLGSVPSGNTRTQSQCAVGSLRG